jgi:hypothetical protein
MLTVGVWSGGDCGPIWMVWSRVGAAWLGVGVLVWAWIRTVISSWLAVGGGWLWAKNILVYCSYVDETCRRLL